jgi:hypothetical protein
VQACRANRLSAVNREPELGFSSTSPASTGTGSSVAGAGLSMALTDTRRTVWVPPARSTATDGLVSSTLVSAAPTPPQLVSSVPSMRKPALSEPAVVPAGMMLAPAAAPARLVPLSGSVTVRAPPPGCTSIVKRTNPLDGETASMR